MRADRSRRLAALEARPAPPPPSQAMLAFWHHFNQLKQELASDIGAGLLGALEDAKNLGSGEDMTQAVVDVMEAIERTDPAAGLLLSRLLDHPD